MKAMKLIGIQSRLSLMSFSVGEHTVFAVADEIARKFYLCICSVGGPG